MDDDDIKRAPALRVDLTPLLVGRTAGELRAMGFGVADSVPDVAELKAEGESFHWSWISIKVNVDYA